MNEYIYSDNSCLEWRYTMGIRKLFMCAYELAKTTN